ncbi:MAG: metallophosphoesterase family protein [Neisseriaceae bacterium]|jgi:Icc protein
MKVIQISDLHFHQDPNHRIFGLVNTNETFLNVLERVIEESPDFVIATGDLSQDGSIESYKRLNNYLKKVPCDIYAIYGNHDLPENFDSTLISHNIKKQKYLHTNFGNFIFLSSYKISSDSGLISDKELLDLEQFLQNYDNCIIVIHHHFIELNSIIDDFILENRNQFLDILLKHKNKIKLCITGHVHNTCDIDFNGIKIHCGLSTCLQFAFTKELLFENKKPGYTVYNFSGDDYEIIEKTV